MTEDLIARINELYHLSKQRELTPSEKSEQTQLRKQYVGAIKKNLTSQLNNIVIDRPDGTSEPLIKKN